MLRLRAQHTSQGRGMQIQLQGWQWKREGEGAEVVHPTAATYSYRREHQSHRAHGAARSCLTMPQAAQKPSVPKAQ